MGLGIFLLHMVQLQAASKNYKIDFHLQSNISSEAFDWYQHCRFVLTPTNDPDQLPGPLKSIYENSSSSKTSNPYIHFVTTEDWNREVKQGGNDPNFEEWQKQRLLLIYLNTTLIMKESGIDIGISASKSDDVTMFYSVLPTDSNDFLLRFPFKECTSCINQVTEGLVIMDHPFFKFHDEGDQLHKWEHAEGATFYGKKVIPFEEAWIHYDRYLLHKKDVETKQYKLWYNDLDINLFYCWLK
jgi:hypothetical protein